MELELNTKKIDNIAVIDTQGVVDAHTAPRLRHVISEVIDSGSVYVVVELNNIEYIDSIGLGTLVSGLNKAAEKGGTLVLVTTNDQVLKVFQITGLDDVFKMYQSEEEALKQLKINKLRGGK